MKTDGTEYQKLLDFNLSNGGAPLGSLILVGTKLYGIASYGPDPYLGEIFEIETDGSDFNIIFSGVKLIAPVNCKPIAL